MPNNNNLLILLRLLSCGSETVFEAPDGKYIPTEFRGSSLVPEGSEERTIESRIQFELYGEYPLSEKDQHDWDSRVKNAFHRYLTY